MGTRLELHALLKQVTGLERVYHQPPSDISMDYPCIIYQRDDIDIKHADNQPYAHKNRYQIMVIYREPESDVPSKIAALPSARYDRRYVADNLNHEVFNLFF